MTKYSRETKVLVVLGVSIILGAIILNALGHNPPSAGAFCLSRYYRLGSVKKSILSRAYQSPGRWSRIEIYYSGTESDKIKQLASFCHFVICNGRVGCDGQIQPTENWQKQSSVIHYSKQTICICVISDDKAAPPSDFQVKRTEALVERLHRKFNIQPESIRYPDDWQ